jgi:hypothetical protein
MILVYINGHRGHGKAFPPSPWSDPPINTSILVLGLHNFVQTLMDGLGRSSGKVDDNGSSRNALVSRYTHAGPHDSDFSECPIVVPPLIWALLYPHATSIQFELD